PPTSPRSLHDALPIFAKRNALAQLEEMHAAAVAHEAEQAKLAKERAKLAEQQAEQKRRDAEAQEKADARAAELQAQQDAIDKQKDRKSTRLNSSHVST